MSAPFEPRIAYIRTSDRGSFKRCRRKWGWTSHLKHGLQISEAALPLWLGTGVHYALEDYHSVNTYETPYKSLRAFAEACRRTPGLVLPDNWREGLELGEAMMQYYLIWLKNRDPLKTYILDGIPQVEVTFQIPLPPEIYKPYGYDEGYYIGTLDRVIIDQYGRLWIVEYKTAAQFAYDHFQTDGQISSYCWAASCIYEQGVAGVIYQQHKKKIPDEPLILQSGKISTNKTQSTTHTYYKKALLNLYGEISKVPHSNVEMLNLLAEREDENLDAFIRRDFINRNQHQIEAEGVKILMEASEMLSPDIPLYPNPTRDCGFCPVNAACVSLDDGSDWEYELEQLTTTKERKYDSWRPYLPSPQSESQ